MLEAAPGPRTTVQSPQRWATDASWKLDYSHVDRIAPEELERLRQEFARQKQIAQQVRQRERA